MTQTLNVLVTLSTPALHQQSKVSKKILEKKKREKKEKRQQQQKFPGGVGLLCLLQLVQNWHGSDGQHCDHFYEEDWCPCKAKQAYLLTCLSLKESMTLRCWSIEFKSEENWNTVSSLDPGWLFAICHSYCHSMVRCKNGPCCRKTFLAFGITTYLSQE